jgi:hypothetical protein
MCPMMICNSVTVEYAENDAQQMGIVLMRQPQPTVASAMVTSAENPRNWSDNGCRRIVGCR